MKLMPSLVALLVGAALIPDARLCAQSRRPSPLNVTADPLPLKEDDQGTLIVHVVALTALARAEITMSARTGVELLKDAPPAAFADLKLGERHDIQVPVRLIAPDFGYVLVSAAVTTARGTEEHNSLVVVGTMPPPAPRDPVAVTEDLSDLTLLKVSNGNGIVRFGGKELLIVRVGDRLGRNKAEIKEIAAGRVVLEETVLGADGRPNRARVTLKEGEKGGTRVLLRNEEEPPAATRQRVVTPSRRGPGKQL